MANPHSRNQHGVADESVSTLSGRKVKSQSMHDGIAVWCDCCSCEAEPYWQEVAEELGIDLGSDYDSDPGRHD